MMELLKRVKHSTFAQAVVKLAGGTSLAHLVTIAVSPILTRLYPVSTFGELQLFHSLIIIGSIVITGAYEYIIVIPKKIKSAISLFVLSFGLALLLSSLLFVPILVNESFLTSALDLDFIILLLFPVTLFFNSSLNIIQYWFLRSNQFGLLSKAKITQSTSIAGVQTGLGFLEKTGFGLIVGYVIGRLVTLMLYITKLEKRFWVEIRKIRKKDIKEVAISYRDQPQFAIISGLLSTGGIEFPIILISTLFGQMELGFYALAYRVLSAPSAFIGNAVGQVFYKQASDIITHKKQLSNTLFKTWLSLLSIAFIPMLILYVYSESIFGFVFGEAWIQAGKVAAILMPLLLIDFLSAPTGKTLILLKKQRMMTLFSAFVFTTRVLGILIGYYFNDFYLGLNILVLLHIIVLISYNAFLFISTKKYDSNVKTGL